MNYSDSSMVQTVKVNMVVNMKYSDFVRYYVKEFKTLEDEFLETDQYVSIDKKNFNTFSHSFLTNIGRCFLIHAAVWILWLKIFV